MMLQPDDRGSYPGEGSDGIGMDCMSDLGLGIGLGVNLGRVLHAGLDKTAEKRVWMIGFALEFRMKLARDVKGMLLDFNHFNQFVSRSGA